MMAGIRVFSQKGFDAARMDEIAQLAGVAKGSLYYHFKSKSDLFATIVVEGISDLQDRMNQILSREDSVRVIIEELVSVNLEICRSFPELVDLIMHEQYGGLDQEAGLHIQQKKQSYIRSISDLLEEGMQEGLLISGDSLSLAAAILSFLHTYYKTADSRGVPFSNITHEVSNWIMKGLCQP